MKWDDFAGMSDAHVAHLGDQTDATYQDLYKDIVVEFKRLAKAEGHEFTTAQIGVMVWESALEGADPQATFINLCFTLGAAIRYALNPEALEAWGSDEL